MKMDKSKWSLNYIWHSVVGIRLRLFTFHVSMLIFAEFNSYSLPGNVPYEDVWLCVCVCIMLVLSVCVSVWVSMYVCMYLIIIQFCIFTWNTVTRAHKSESKFFRSHCVSSSPSLLSQNLHPNRFIPSILCVKNGYLWLHVLLLLLFC